MGERMRYLLLALVLCGCSTERVYLRNAAGVTATCGPYSTTDNYGSAEAAAMRERQCIQDYQRQGFERAAK